MKSEDEYRLSFYKDCGDLDERHNIKLVRHTESGNIYVKKEMYDYDLSVFRVLEKRRYDGIPEIKECVEDEESHKLTVIEEFINGRTLRAILDHKGTLPEDQAVSVLKAICDTLEPLHRCDPPIVHRDIKPENILITEDSRLYIVDFDASRSVKEGQSRDTQLIGTRKYAAPEQYGYSQSEPRTDIYAIGKVGLEMVTGSTDRADGKSPDPLLRILSRCTSMDPEDRFSSVSELRGALSSIDSFNPLGRFSRYALPGFRTNRLWRKILSAVLYIALFAWMLSVDFSAYSLKVRILSYVCTTVMLMSLILFYGNYLDMHRHIPLMKSKNLLIRIAGYIIYTYVILFVLRMFFTVLGLPTDI